MGLVVIGLFVTSSGGYRVGVKRWLPFFILIGVLFATAFVGFSYVTFQLSILQPPVIEPNFVEKKRSQRFRETQVFAPIDSYQKLEAGQATLYKSSLVKAGTAARAVLLLPDSGTGAWVFEKWLPELVKTNRVYAASLRGMFGAKSAASTTTFNDYLTDARAALEAVQKDSGSSKIALVGEGMGAMLALKLANENPDSLESLTLVSPYGPRDWSDQQVFLANFIGERAYSGVFAGGEPAQTFWLENFPSWVVQRDTPRSYLERYAAQKVPFEFEPVIREITLGRLDWLQAAYDKLEKAKFPVLHIAARYDVLNPLNAQLEMRRGFEQQLDRRYNFALLLSGRLVSIDWKWREAVTILETFLNDGKLEKSVIQNEEALDPLLEQQVR
jgi:pimeloyl-ACP methyl ester carboxylesterase